MNLFAEAFAWLFSPERFEGTYALPTLLGQHLLYTAVSVVVAALIALPAGWLIERAGFGRGYGTGAVGISNKHTLALVNRGGGTTADLLDLARELRDGVHAAFGVTLAVEPTLVGVSL